MTDPNKALIAQQQSYSNTFPATTIGALSADVAATEADIVILQNDVSTLESDLTALDLRVVDLENA